MTQDKSYAQMKTLLEATGQAILLEIWKFYPRAPKMVDGVRKWTGWCMVSDEPKTNEVTDGILADIETTRSVLSGKQSVLVPGKVETSISKRNPVAEPKIWGGGSLTFWNWKDALSGGPELVDHLILSKMQQLTGRISENRYAEQTSVDHPGIRDAINFCKNLGLTEDKFLAMRTLIEDILENAFAIEGF